MTIRYLLITASTCLLCLYCAIGLQAKTNYPRLAMQMKIVKETEACHLKNGYDIKKSCPPLTIEQVNRLSGTVAETTPSPPEQTVFLGDQMYTVLERYYKDWENKKKNTGNKKTMPDLENRKAMILIFDFGNPQQRPKQNLEIRLARKQVNHDCKEEQKPTIPEGCLIYNKSFPSNNRYLIFHERADYYIPRSNVVWTVIARDTLGKEMYRWTFKTGQ
jgi:hypothetical protein